MVRKLTREELVSIGVNPDNLNYDRGEMNIIVQLFGTDKEDAEDDGEDFQLYPDIYQPRKNSVYSCGCTGDGIPVYTKEDRDDFVRHLRDSSERLKILSHYLKCQADEIERDGYPTTSCYYPE